MRERRNQRPRLTEEMFLAIAPGESRVFGTEHRYRTLALAVSRFNYEHTLRRYFLRRNTEGEGYRVHCMTKKEAPERKAQLRLWSGIANVREKCRP